jgi:hypothetical protein
VYNKKNAKSSVHTYLDRGYKSGKWFTEGIVSFIQLLYHILDYPQKSISEETGVYPVTISDIAGGKPGNTYKYE